MSIDVLKKNLSEKNLRGVYLLFGDERYYTDHYAVLIKNALNIEQKDFNISVLGEDDFSYESFSSATNTPPIMDEHKLVIINTDKFFSKNDKLSDEINSLFDNFPSYLTILILCDSVDKRGSMYKTVSKKGIATEFLRLKKQERIVFIKNYIINAGKTIKDKDAELIVEISDEDLYIIKTELDKLINFCHNKSAIDESDIKNLSTISVKSKIWDMTDNIVSKNNTKAFSILKELKSGKESAIMVLYFLARELEKMLICAVNANKRLTPSELATLLGVPYFAVKKYEVCGERFKELFLSRAISECVRLESAIKNGEINEWVACESFLLKLLSYK